MQYNELAGLRVSTLGMGCGGFGRLYGKEESQETATSAVRLALERGINLFDTAPFYGNFRSEQMLGQAFADVSNEFPRSSYLISTKVGRYAKGPPHPVDDANWNWSAKRIAKSFQGSLKRLQTTSIDILFCHDVEYGDLNLLLSEALPLLFNLKKKGLIRRIGISAYNLDSLSWVLENSPVRIDVILSYCMHNLHTQQLARAVCYWRSLNPEVGVINASPLSMGLLTSSGAQPWHPASTYVKRRARLCSELCLSKGTDLARLGAIWCFKNSQGVVDVTLAGFKRPVEVRVSLEAYQAALSPSATSAMELELMDEVLKLMAPVSQDIWVEGEEENRKRVRLTLKGPRIWNGEPHRTGIFSSQL